MTYISYDNIIAGSILKFGKLDNTDINFISKKVESVTQVDLHYRAFCSPLNNCLQRDDDGTITIANQSEEAMATLKEFAKPLESFFESLDVEAFKKEKKEYLETAKRELLSNANILIISEDESDYEALKNYGYSNIDYFKSLIRANRYFSSHPEELQKYHIMLLGKHSINHCCFDGNVWLESEITRVAKESKVIESEIFRCDYDYATEYPYAVFLQDYYLKRSWEAGGDTFDEVISKITEAATINEVLIKNPPIKPFEQIKDCTNPEIIPLPKKLEDLKILFLGLLNNDELTKMTQSLGISCTFLEDTNSALGKHVKEHLGEYDIILVSRSYSGAVLEMTTECTEQCKDTGRQLVLLVSYDIDHILNLDEDEKPAFDLYGSQVKIQYRFAGPLVFESDIQEQNFKVLRKSNQRYENQSIRFGILCAVVNLFDEFAKSLDDTGFENNTLPSAIQLNEEYIAHVEQEKLNRALALKPIEDFDRFVYLVENYLLKKPHIKNRDLQIIESQDGIKVQALYNGNPICAITYRKSDATEHIRIFLLQVLTKKGTLSAPVLRGFYTKKYEKLQSTPSRPTEEEEKAIDGLFKKVANEAFGFNNSSNQSSTEASKPFVQKPINRKHNRRKKRP